MSKAFTKESDGEDSQNDEIDRDDSLKGKNYMTPGGAKKLQDEFRRLKSVDRPEVVKTVEWAAGNGDRSENGDYLYGKKRLREIDRRLRFLSKRLDALEIVDPTKIKSDQVLFGATVTFADENDVEKTFSIVGLDEADVLKKKISWAGQQKVCKSSKKPITLSIITQATPPHSFLRSPSMQNPCGIARALLAIILAQTLPALWLNTARKPHPAIRILPS